MPNLRAGLIGLGMMGRHHARNLRALEGVDLVGVADAMGDPHGAAHNLEVNRDFRDLFKLDLDYCVIALPTESHEEAALAAAAAGVHALVEKPLAPSVESALKIAGAFDQAGLIGAVGHVERFNPAAQELRKRLSNGDLGKILQVATRRQGPFPARIADVGVVKDLGSHDFDLTTWITGEAYLELYARTMFKAGRAHEDMVAITANLTGGIISNHLVNWLTPAKERLTIVTGESGVFVADTLLADLTFYANGSIATQWSDIANFRGVSEGDVIRYAIPKPEPLSVEHKTFRDAILHNDQSQIVTMWEGLNTVRVCEAVLESASTSAVAQLDQE